jgi:thiol-disulfide isomerase/thioredoxin
MNPTLLRLTFDRGLTYARYVITGTAEQQRRWQQVYDAAKVTPQQALLVRSFAREMKLLVVSGVWCGDCVQQCPLVERIAEVNPKKITVHYVDRDEHAAFAEELRINGGDRVPVVVFMAEDFEPCSVLGDRTLNRYRALARRQLGPACSTGLVVPDADEMAATLQDWVDEFERVQLMLRLSPRLRERHGD